MLTLVSPSINSDLVPNSTVFLQPEGSFCLTVTWTPTEEGGMRELIIFNANGVLKHQAVMLGRAEAPKKKKVGSRIFFSFMAEQKSYSYSDKCVYKHAGIEQLWGYDSQFNIISRVLQNLLHVR